MITLRPVLSVAFDFWHENAFEGLQANDIPDMSNQAVREQLRRLVEIKVTGSVSPQPCGHQLQIYSPVEHNLVCVVCMVTYSQSF